MVHLRSVPRHVALGLAMYLITIDITLVLSAAPISNTLNAVSRVANFGDVAHTFESAFKLDPQCPSKVEISSINVDSTRNIGTVPLNQIKEDGQVCSGKGTSVMSLVSEATVKSNDLLRRLGFPLAYAGLQKNEAALATVKNKKSDSSLLVGFDEGERTCGTSTYGDSTFWFVIREPSKFRIVIRTGVKLALTNITLPENTRALFVTDGKKKLCLLYDKSTAGGKAVTVTTQNEAGVVQPSASPSSSPSPKPSESAEPKNSTTPTPSASSSAMVNGSTSSPSASVSVGAPPSATPLEVPAPTDVSTVVAEPTPTTGGGSVCFPGHARVELEDGALVPISTLRLGDRVRTGATTYSDVFMFSHRDAAARSLFVRLVTSARAQVTLTHSHYVYANDKLVAAGAVRVGDSLVLADGSHAKVTTVETVSSKGLYNPHTLDGTIIVDGILTSTYTTSVHPMAAHAGLLAPLRWVYSRIGANAGLDALAGMIGSSADILAQWVPSGPSTIVA